MDDSAAMHFFRTLRRTLIGLSLVATLCAGVVVAQAALAAPRSKAAALLVDGPPESPNTVVAGTVCPDRQATEISVASSSVLADGSGGFWVADLLHSTVCHIDATGAVTHVAGTGASGYFPAPLGDDVAATGAMLYEPNGLAVADDSLLVADRRNHLIRRVGSDGVISTIAGNGLPGSSGDGGPAADARLKGPTDVAVDPATGTIYIADAFNHRIRAIGPDGRISTVAGTGVAGATGDGGPAVAARLQQPTNIAVGPDGALYISDSRNHRVRRVVSGNIDTVLGTGQSGAGGPGLGRQVALNTPAGLDVAPDGTLYVVDNGNARVLALRVLLLATVVPTEGSNPLVFAMDVSVDGDGSILVADLGIPGVVRINPIIGTSTVAAGNGRMLASGDGGPATAAQLHQPMAVDVGADGTVVVADAHNDAIRAIAPDGTMRTISEPGLDFPTGVHLRNDGSILVADTFGHRVWLILPNGDTTVLAGTGQAGNSGDGAPATSATLDAPSDAVDGAGGNIYVLDMGAGRVRRIDGQSKISAVPGGDGFTQPQGMVWDGASGTLVVADTGAHRLVRLNPVTGQKTAIAGNPAAGRYSKPGTVAIQAGLNSPRDVELGANGDIYYADTGNCMVRVVRSGKIQNLFGWSPARGVIPTCGYLGVDGLGMLSNPSGVALGPDGRLFVADSINHRVRAVGN